MPEKIHPIDVKELIRQTVSYPHEDVIATADSGFGYSGTYELTIKTSITKEEMDAIEERFKIVEIYGFGPMHFATNPESSEELGLILDIN